MLTSIKYLGEYRASLVAQLVKNLLPMRETWVWFLDWEDTLEKGTATHPSILIWRIPWTEQSMGSQRVGATFKQLSNFHLLHSLGEYVVRDKLFVGINYCSCSCYRHPYSDCIFQLKSQGLFLYPSKYEIQLSFFFHHCSLVWSVF